MKAKRIGYVLLVLSMAMGGWMGCNSDSNNDNPSPPTVNVTGSWVGASDAGYALTLVLQQTNATVTGTGKSNGQSALVQGTVEGNTFNFQMIYDIGVADCSATVEGNSMSGTAGQPGVLDYFTANRY